MRHFLSISAALLCAIAWAQERPVTLAVSWHVARENFTAPPGATLPKLVKGQYSTSLKAGLNHAASISFEISEKGIPFNIRVENSSDTESADEVIALIREWRFEAAMKNGLPVPSNGLLDLSIGDGTARPRKKK
jgi:hypothetical protein